VRGAGPRNQGTNASRPSVTFLARNLERTGGAEQQLARLAIGLRRRGWSIKVLTFYPSNDGLEGCLSEAEVPVHCLDKTGRSDTFGFVRRLTKKLTAHPPNILQSYLTPPNIFAAWAACGLPETHLVWGVRATAMDLRRYDWTHRAVEWGQARLSRWPKLIIVNSHAGMAELLRRGYPRPRVKVVTNGVDTDVFFPDRDSALACRLKAGWLKGASGPLVGLIARLDPMKDHASFLRAARGFIDKVPGVRFVCVGSRATSSAQDILSLCSNLGLDEFVRWEEPRADIPTVLNALDLVTLSSAFGEGFPNILGEAMACGVPVVATDVGDSARVIGDVGRVVPPHDPRALMAAWTSVLDIPDGERRRLGASGSARIETHFALSTMVKATADLYLSLNPK
jgi:glycosyltransferase involved in cell wall biosynthesis